MLSKNGGINSSPLGCVDPGTVPDLGPDQPTVEDRVSFRVTAQAYAIVFTALRVLYEFWHEKVLDLFL